MPPLTLMFQTSLRTGVLPAAWKKANITAFHKKGGKHVTRNYRPVSLTSIICKVMESIVRNAFVKYMKENLLFTDRQFGGGGGGAVPPLASYWRSSMTGLRSWIGAALWMWCTVTSWKPLTLFHMAASSRSLSITGSIVSLWSGSGGSWQTGNNVW